MRSTTMAIVAVLMTASLAPSAAGQQPSPAIDSGTAATARRLLTVMGSAKLAVQSMEAMLPAQKAALPQVPAAFWDAFLSRARHDTTALAEMLVPIYAAHFTRGELEGLIAFYQTPLGAKVARVQPAITQESIEAGRNWGATIGREIGDSLAQAGVKFSTPQ